MKNLALGCIAALATSICGAQPFHVTYSAPITSTAYDYDDRASFTSNIPRANILQLPNGNTCLVHELANKRVGMSSVHVSKGFRLLLWDRDRKLIQEQQELGINTGITYGASLRSCVFNTGNDIVVIRQTIPDLGTMALHRYVFDGNSGALKSDTTWAELKVTSGKKSYIPGFRVTAGRAPAEERMYTFGSGVRDAASGAYVLAHNYDVSAAESRLELLQYSDDHTLRLRHSFRSPDPALPRVRLLDIIVEGDSAVILATICHTGPVKGKNRQEAYLTRMTAAGAQHCRLGFMLKDDTKGMIAADSAGTAVAVVLRNTDHYNDPMQPYQMYAGLVDGKTLTPRFFKPIRPQAPANKYRIRHLMTPHGGYHFEAKDLSYSPAGGMQVLFEDGDVFGNINVGYYAHKKGLSFISFDDAGEMLTTGSVFKAQPADQVDYFSQHEWRQGLSVGTSWGMEHYHAEFNQQENAGYTFPVNGRTYALFNSRPANAVAAPEEPLKVSSILKKDYPFGVYLQHTEAGSLPQNLLGVPEDGSASRRIFTPATSFDPATRTLAVLVESNGNKEAVLQLAWIPL